jgi:F-type H+-transporting ATPase subunit delta
MKISAKQYAETLFQSVEGQSKDKAKKIIKNFAKVLIENNHASQIEKILSYFNSIWNKNKGVVEAEIISAHELDKDAMIAIDEFIKKNADNREVEIKKTANLEIRGGFVVRLGDQIFDSSLKTRLNELKKYISS